MKPPFLKRRSRVVLLGCSAWVTVALTGCWGGSSSSGHSNEPSTLTGTFIDSAVAGLNYRSGDRSDLTSNQGEFKYVEGETVSFSLGELSLGAATGAQILTPLSIIDGAASTDDQRVTNLLVLLQTLDADGDLNNGIQITEAIRDEVSLNSARLTLDQTPVDFATQLEGVVATLEEADVFTDLDPRMRKVVKPGDAITHFERSTGPRKVVATANGDLRGFQADENIWQFLGVPYAKPPVGDLRWRAPQQPESWDGTRDAVAWSDQAAQNPGLERFGEGGMSEDSLYLNLTVPKDATGLPVMVWFHGGGFTSLTSNTKPFNNPKALATKGVVQVSVNQRLGPFGYIAHPELSAENAYAGSGNYGQMDLIMALEWVRDNIQAFGGDPNNVTVFGESGGGRKVLSLMASPKATGLFHKAISQSGTLIPDTRSLAAAEAIGVNLQSNLQATSLEEMRSKSWLEVVAASATLVPYTNVDNEYLPTTERAIFESGSDNDVPFMFSINTNDTVDPTETVKTVFPWMAPLKDSPIYATLFSHQPAGWKQRGMQAYHGAELAYLFNILESVVAHYQLGLVLDPATGRPLLIGDLNGNGVAGSAGDPEDILTSAGFDEVDAQVVDRMMTIWTNFAKTGDPSVSDVVDYPVYDASIQKFVELNDGIEVGVGLAELFPD